MCCSRGPNAVGAQANEGNVIVARTTGGVEYGRPLATGWTGTAGLNWQRSKCLDDHGRVITEASRAPHDSVLIDLIGD